MATNVIVVCVFGLVAYDRYAKRWSAKTGNYSVPGKITWSERMLIGKKRTLISYSYRVAGTLYNGEIHPPFHRIDETIRDYPKGKEITVFYAQKDPGFSRVDKPAGHFDIIGTSVMYWLVLPALFANFVSGFIYAVANAN